MNKNNTNYLLKKYSKLYRQHALPMTQTCMCWGFAFGDGWFKIIDGLSADLVNEDPTVQVTQAKEKFGLMRIYTSFSTPKIDKLIARAESKSSKTCEMCGTTKGVTTAGPGWIRTLCTKCRKNKYKED